MNAWRTRIAFINFRLRQIERLLSRYELLAGIASRSDYLQCKIYTDKINYLNTRWLELDNEKQKLSQWQEFNWEVIPA